MKLLLFTLALATAVNFANAQTLNGIPLPIQIIREATVEYQGELINRSRENNFYNPDSTLKQVVYEVWDTVSQSWKNDYQSLFSYSPDGHLVEELSQQIDFETNSWNNQRRYSYTYYPDPAYLDGGFHTRLYEYWDKANNEWDTVTLVINTAFDAGSGDLEGTLWRYVSQSGNPSQPHIIQQIYDRVATPNGVRIASIVETGWIDGDFKYVYTYNDDQKLDYDTLIIYGGNSNSWWPRTRKIQTINNLENIVVSQYRDLGNWINSSQTTTQYNSYGQIVLSKLENWWITGLGEHSRVETYYNPDHSKSKVVGYITSPGSGTYMSGRRTYLYNTSVGSHTPLEKAQIFAFPNPAYDVVQISLDNVAGKETSCTLLDVKGRVCARAQTTDNFATIPLATQPSGTYFIRVEQDGIIQKVMPLVKQ